MTALSRAARNPIGWAVLLVLVVLACASVFSIVPETGQGIVLRLGQPQRVVNGFGEGGDGAGLVAHLPLVEQVVLVDRRVRDVEVERQPVTTGDGALVDVDAFARYRIVDPLRFLRAAGGDEQRFADAVRPAFGAALRDGLNGQPLAAMQGPALGPVLAAIDRAARPFGVRAVDVRVARVSLPEGAPREAVLDRMRGATQQQALAVRTDGMRQAAAIRSEADAAAARISADSFGRDPAFYDFYRSMQSYRTSFGVDAPTEGGTTIVLSGDSAYLRNFTGARAK